MRLLLVEDDVKIASFIIKGLRSAGYAVEHALDGEAGLDLALSEPYDVMVIDIMLPKRDGLSLIRHLREQKVNTPALILSAKGSVEDRVKGLETGADDYLTKPFAFSELLTLICDIPDNCDILGDIRSIQRMLSNLLDNAIKYTASGGTVRVRVPECTGNTPEITVTDTGIGISAEDLPHIFERFYRCDRSRSEAGTGLGLSLARAIARSHGGDITAASRPGRGSTFTVTLPQVLTASF